MNGLQDIYDRMFGEAPAAGAAPVEAQTKTAQETASAQSAETAPESNTEVLGELTSALFTDAVGQMFGKVAGDLEAEAGAGHKPLGETPSSMGKSMGMGGNPHMPVNYSTGDHEKIHASTGGQSPYSIKEKALAKAILRRMNAAPVGGFHE
jgi:hypothetical protein